MDMEVLLWWQRLEEKEQNILIELLHKLDLKDYVRMDADGNILEMIN